MFKMLKNLQRQGIDLFKNFENRFLESNAVNVLKEKYQSLSMANQKLIKYGLIVFLFVFVVYLPVSYLSSSISSWSDFKQKYILSLELLKTRNKSSSFLKLSEEALKLKINRVVEKYSSDDFEVIGAGKPFPKVKSINQVDFNISLRHLNIKQAVRLGTELNSLPQMRLSEISLSANKEYEKHYDINYKLLAFVSKGVGASSVIKRRPINKRKGFSRQMEEESESLKEKKVTPVRKKRKRRPRKRKAVGDQ